MSEIFDYYLQISGEENVNKNKCNSNKKKKKVDTDIHEVRFATIEDVANYKLKQENNKSENEYKIFVNSRTAYGIGITGEIFIFINGRSERYHLLNYFILPYYEFIYFFNIFANGVNVHSLSNSNTTVIFNYCTEYRFHYLFLEKCHSIYSDYIVKKMLLPFYLLIYYSIFSTKKLRSEISEEVFINNIFIYKKRIDKVFYYLCSNTGLEFNTGIGLYGYDGGNFLFTIPNINGRNQYFLSNIKMCSGIFSSIIHADGFSELFSNHFISLSVGSGINLTILNALTVGKVCTYLYTPSQKFKQAIDKLKSSLSPFLFNELQLHLCTKWHVSFKFLNSKNFDNTFSSSEHFKDPFINFMFGFNFVFNNMLLYIRWGLGYLNISQAIMRIIMLDRQNKDIDQDYAVTRVCQGGEYFKNKIFTSECGIRIVINNNVN